MGEVYSTGAYTNDSKENNEDYASQTTQLEGLANQIRKALKLLDTVLKFSAKCIYSLVDIIVLNVAHVQMIPGDVLF